MPLELEILLEQVLPAGVAAAVVLLACWRWRDAAWPASVATALGVVAGQALMTGGAPDSWPRDTTLLAAHFFADLPALSALLLGLAPLFSFGRWWWAAPASALPALAAWLPCRAANPLMTYDY